MANIKNIDNNHNRSYGKFGVLFDFCKLMALRILHIALPVMGESANLDQFFECMEKQSFKDFMIYICVNQYESWWNDPEKVHYCLDNAKSINYIKSSGLVTEIIDKSSKGKGWPEKRGGVGWARKVLMDRISKENKNDTIVSMDADTFYPEDYLESIHNYFMHHPESVGLSIPYFHPLAGDETDRHILRYEMYMRYYALNMLRIQNPYSFTALGSAMALPVWAYLKIGGMTPVKSGEDFYLIQKLVKNGNVGQWVDTTAYPASRYSDRVLFGTGPALIKGAKGDWGSYPVYQPSSFDLVKKTHKQFSQLFKRDVHTPMTDFLKEQFKTDDLWGPLRQNYKDEQNFIKACSNKVDGLRILQFLRHQKNNSEPLSDEYVLTKYLQEYFAKEIDSGLIKVLKGFDYNTSSIADLDLLRQFLQIQEANFRRKRENI
ncbi:MAG: hypothetical protein C0591_06185 [Marinilabiliales bacterium]|nr:MAG: hypothetical protein C0591_06185 [Marinilabiliales bacterium]